MPLLDSASILEDFDRSSVSVTSYAIGTIDALGRSIPGAETITVRNPVVHTTPERELALLPEAIRPREAITIYDTIAYASLANDTAPARVTYQGREYRVLMTADYSAHGEIFIMTAGLVDT